MERTLRLPVALRDAQLRVALVTAFALVAEAVLAKNVIGVELDFISQFAALWVFIGFQAAGKRDRVTELATDATIVLVTAAVLALYSV
jgi:hypothetical protein